MDDHIATQGGFVLSIISFALSLLHSIGSWNITIYCRRWLAVKYPGLKWDTGSTPTYAAQDLDNTKQAAVVGWVKQSDAERMVAGARVGWVEEQEVERRAQAEKVEWERERDTAVRMAEARVTARVGLVEAGEVERRLDEEMARVREVERLRGELMGLKAVVAAKDAEIGRWEGESIRKAAMWERLVTGGGVRLVAKGAPERWKPDPPNSWLVPSTPALSSHQRFSSR